MIRHHIHLLCTIRVLCFYWYQGRLGFSMEELFAGGGNMGGGGGGAAAAAAPEPVKEKEAFDLKLTEVPAAAKIKVIKEVRAITGLGLKEVSIGGRFVFASPAFVTFCIVMLVFCRQRTWSKARRLW